MKQFYILVNADTNKPLFLKLPKKHFIFIANEHYFSSTENIDEFTLEEKLCVLNHPINLVWKKISLLKVLFKYIFFNTTTPVDFKLFPMNNKITILINGKVQGNLIIK